MTQHLPAAAAERKAIPLATGALDYFPDALLAVAALSKVGNDQHNPGQPLHWSRGKSDDHPDCLMRHFVDRGTIDTDGVRHSAKVAWRALAILQLEIEGAAPASSLEALLDELKGVGNVIEGLSGPMGRVEPGPGEVVWMESEGELGAPVFLEWKPGTMKIPTGIVEIRIHGVKDQMVQACWVNWGHNTPITHYRVVE